jgi:hypothetical protein
VTCSIRFIKSVKIIKRIFDIREDPSGNCPSCNIDYIQFGTIKQCNTCPPPDTTYLGKGDVIEFRSSSDVVSTTYQGFRFVILP